MKNRLIYKHIKKEFLFEYETKDIPQQYKTHTISSPDLVTKIKKSSDKLIYVSTSENKHIGGFAHNLNGHHIVYPIPDPTLVYFNMAQKLLTDLESIKSELRKKLILNQYDETVINEIYFHYGIAATIIIQLFMSLESFINQLIPYDYVFKIDKQRYIELYDWEQIQRHLQWKTKTENVLPEVTNKHFFTSSSPSLDHIRNLKKFRDDLVHTKKSPTEFTYDDIIKKTLNFKYAETIDAVAICINTYKPGTIKVCGCPADH